MQECHVDGSSESSHHLILGKDLLTAMGLDLNIPKHVIEGG